MAILNSFCSNIIREKIGAVLNVSVKKGADQFVNFR